MDNRLWRWWAELARVAEAVGAVHLFTDARVWPSIESRRLHPNPTAVVAVEERVPLAFADGTQVMLRRGDVALIGTGVWHEHGDGVGTGAWFGQGFMPVWSDLTLPVRDGMNGVGRLAPLPTRTLLAAAFAAPPARRRAAVADWLQQLVQERVTVVCPQERPLLAMVHQMWKRAHVRITPDELVAASGAARARAYRLFTGWYGLTPKAFILAARLELAAALLAQGLGVAEVAWRCGWDNPTTFARCWRRAHGANPSQAGSLQVGPRC